MRQLFFAVSLFSLLLAAGCFFNIETREAPKDADLKMGLSIDREKAFVFSNQIVEDIIAERHQEIYSKMGEVIRQTYPADEIPRTLEKLNSYFGKLLEAEPKNEEVGYWTYHQDGAKLPMRKYWYATKTEKAEKGKYFLQVTVIAEGEKLACASFSMLDFPKGIPENLK